MILYLFPLKTRNLVLGILCLRIEQGVSWFASTQLLQEEGQTTDRATFFWTFLDQAILVIEQERLRTHIISNNE